MDIKELKRRCEEKNIPFAYGLFKNPIEPPFLVAISSGSNNALADGIVYKRIEEIELDFAFIDKDFELENTIENYILKDVVWNKTEETYIEEEKIFQVSYFFDILKEE